MGERTLTFRPSPGEGFPTIEGLDADGEVWELSLAVHRDLLVEITGVEPRSDLSLQELATMTARLEGYVERTKRVPKATPEPERRAAFLPDHRLLAPVRRLLEPIRRVVRYGRDRPDGRATTEQPDAEWCVETVHELAKVLRAATDARRREITAAATTPATVASD